MPASELDVIVVGAGHAGCEAALAASRIGARTLLLTQNLDTIGLMSCNPAVGGVGKGQLVRELDALGGSMAMLADSAGIHFRQLNTSKGRAVRSSRCQVDRQLYRVQMKEAVEHTDRLRVYQGTCAKVLTRGRRATGVITETGEHLSAKAVVLAPGTFLNGLVHIGLHNFPAGRMSEAPAIALAENLARLGFRMGRFKTGTPARLDIRTLDTARMKRQAGDEPVVRFSGWTQDPPANKVDCHITYTNPKTHKIVRAGLKQSPLYSGAIKGRGVRYCPSIEDKVTKFPDRDQHHVFIEPEGLNTVECYPNGISTSLPMDIQLKMLHSIEGLKSCRMTRPGYAIEHDYLDPTQLFPTLETRLLRNLYLAGQLNGTTGYEEAAAQGLVAGANAALRALDRDEFTLSRTQAYIGVMIDDLVTRGTDEPYRMFTARVEYRLLLREDNADLRLGPLGHKLGLLSSARFDSIGCKQRSIERAHAWLKQARVRPTRANIRRLKGLGTAPVRESVPPLELLLRPEVSWTDLERLADSAPSLSAAARDVVELEVKYSGYVERFQRQVRDFAELESVRIPKSLDYGKVPGLSTEVRERLARSRPLNLAQAQNLPGVTPAAVFSMLVFLKAKR